MSDGHEMAATCAVCRGPLPPQRPRGRRRTTCSDRCRKEASRRRRAGESWQPWSAPAASSLPADPVSRRRELVEDLLKLGAGERPRAAIDQIALAVVELKQLLWTMRRAAAELEPDPAAAKVHRAAERIAAIVDDEFF